MTDSELKVYLDKYLKWSCSYHSSLAYGNTVTISKSQCTFSPRIVFHPNFLRIIKFSEKLYSIQCRRSEVFNNSKGFNLKNEVMYRVDVNYTVNIIKYRNKEYLYQIGKFNIVIMLVDLSTYEDVYDSNVRVKLAFLHPEYRFI